jgi:hypothetical protein
MTHILVGESAVNHFFNEDWDELEEAILKLNNGDIVGWNEEKDSVATLLDMLSGWGEFIELSGDDLRDITLNTNIIII